VKNDTTTALPRTDLRKVKKLREANVVVGIPSYNNAPTINYVVYQAAKGLQQYFPELKSAIIVTDGGSTDGTLETVKAMQLPFQVDVLLTTYVGPSGKGSAVKAVFEATRILKAEAVVLVDSDLRSISPDWIRYLASPVLGGIGLVTPLYRRHKYDGTITKFLCYPLTSSLYGKKIRQPIGGDFGLSAQLVDQLLESNLWKNEYTPRFGIDIFETHSALAFKQKVKQASLGLKIHDAKDPAKHLTSMFRQVVGSMFACIKEYEEAWRKPQSIHDVEIVGDIEAATTPEPVEVDFANLARECQVGVATNRKLYRSILGDRLYNKIACTTDSRDADVDIPAETWTKIVYSFAVGYKNCSLAEGKKLLDALRFLWMGRIATYGKETVELDSTKAEKLVQAEAETFYKMRYLLFDSY
jgi:glycosyltransferase involved in cell wall biosynthesis